VHRGLLQIIDDFRALHRFIEEIIKPISLNEIEYYIKDVNIIVNTTSVGLRDDDRPLFDYELIEKRHTVVDIIYRKTPLLEVADKKGCKWQDGLPMLLYQGVKAFEIWTGKEPDIDKIKGVLKKGD